MNIEESKVVDIENINIESIFIHYTNASNLESILSNGLEPRIGINSKGIEKNKKVFFSVGDKNTLILMDAWIKWIILRPSNNQIYVFGAYLMTKKWFPKFVVDIIFKTWIKDDKRKNKACKKLKKSLDNSVFLKLNLEENVDFDYHDIDEVKNQKFSRKQLKYVYSYGHDVECCKMEPWNMHTYFGKKIEKDKISVLKIGDSYSVNDILKYMAIEHADYIKDNCNFLLTYLQYI